MRKNIGRLVRASLTLERNNMNAILSRIYPSSHVWEGGDGKWHRYIVILTVFERPNGAFELRIKTSGCQGQAELQRFRAGSIGEFVPLAIKGCLVDRDTFRDFVYMAEDLRAGEATCRFSDRFGERPHIAEGAQDDYCYEVLGEHNAWALGINADGSVLDVRSGYLYTAQDIVKLIEAHKNA